MRSVDVAEIIGIKRNVYCRNLTQIIYTHSEHPIIAMQMYCAKFIACISLHEFIMYSLEDFELTAHENFEAESVANRNINRSLLSLAVAEELIYIGAHDGTLRIFKLVGDSLQKMR